MPAKSNEGMVSGNLRSRSSALLVTGFMAMEVMRSLFAEGMYEFSTNRQPLVSYSQVVFFMELCKISVALLMVLRSSRNFGLENFFFFLPQATLYFINNCLYFWVLRDSTTGALSLLMHLRLPLTAIVHHYMVVPQKSLKVWASIVVVFIGVIIAQLTDEFTMGYNGVVSIAIVICLNSAVASVMNEKVLKTLQMPFWDQQLRIYALGVSLSLLGLLFDGKSPSIGIAKGNSAFVLATAGCILSGAFSGIMTGFLMLRLDNVVKVVASSGVTVIVSIAVYLVYGLFPFDPWHFAAGSLSLLVGSYFYASETSKHNHSYSSLQNDWPQQHASSLMVNLRKLVCCLLILATFTLITSRPRIARISDVSMIHDEAVKDADLFLAASHAEDIDARIFKDKPLVIVSYLSDFNMMPCRAFRSMLAYNLTVFIVGHLQERSKSIKPFKYLNVSRKAQYLRDDQILGFIDGFDVLAQRDETYIVDEFRALGSNIVYSAEKNCWPYTLIPEAEEKLCPRYPSDDEVAKLYAPGKDVHWPNSGIMFCKAKACEKFYEDSIATVPEWFPDDDQAIAQEICLSYGKDCSLDLHSRIAQSMFWAEEDVIEIDNQYFNNITKSTPAFLHFNGNKDPFEPMDLLHETKTGDLDGRWIYFENGDKRSLKELCAAHLGEL